MGRLKLFEEAVEAVAMAVFLDCSEEVRMVRLMERAEGGNGGGEMITRRLFGSGLIHSMVLVWRW